MPIRFDAIIKDAVDNLKRIIASSQHANRTMHDNRSKEELIASPDKLASQNVF